MSSPYSAKELRAKVSRAPRRFSYCGVLLCGVVGDGWFGKGGNPAFVAGARNWVLPWLQNIDPHRVLVIVLL